ncbi:hypothetical protein KFK09_010947 [Dendrobium nobile]|uniref:Fanconi anemia group I protein n=1 Tax=Dendrobium nobile TaxID=94219 RepID=A0A8T3BBG5_DENNO|nr:hypothetical protein KFK09_010947 [Dendrobium nobile]
MAATATTGARSQSRRELSPPPSFTADDIILLAQNSSATLPPSLSSSTVLPLLQSPSPTLLSSLLSLLSRSPPSSSLLTPVLLSFLRLFFSRTLPRNLDSSRLFYLIFPLLSHLDHSHLHSLLDLIFSHLSDIADADDAQVLDLLPHLLNLAAPDGELINAFLDKLLSVSWSKALLVKMCSLIRDCPAISRVRVSEFLRKIFDGMRDVDIQDLPWLVFQLLLLASKGISSVSRKQLIADLLKFFEKPMKGSPSVVRQVEGTILMHVNFAVKQDPSLGSEVIAVVRSDFGTFNHFAAAVLLSVASIRRFNEISIAALKSVIIGSHLDCKIARDCKWLPDITKEELLQTAKHVEKALVRTINESSSGREHLVPSILQFGFIMLDSVDGKNCEGSGISNGLMSCEELGIQMLKTLFDVHEMTRNQMIEQCKFRILSLNHQKSSPVIKLLGYLVKDYPYPMLEYVARLKELLDYFTFMHEKTAISVIDAILPLIKFSKDLRDYIILVVRKAMFRREDAVRSAAASTIIDLILEENRSKRNDSFQESSSQASCSQQAESFCRTEGCLFQELNGLLRRCLTQQVSVKEIVYKGLTKLVMLDPSTSGHVFDILWPHFLQFYSQDAEYPLRLDVCYVVENGKFSQIEPLDQLLSCVSWVVLLQQHGRSNHQSEYSLPCFGFTLSQDNEAGRVSSSELFKNALSKIRKTLSKWIFEVNFKQNEGLGSHSFQGEKSEIYGCLLRGILEVFINIAATELEKAAHEDEAVLEKEIMWLVDSYDYVEKESGLNKQGSGIRKGTSKTVDQHKTDRELKDSPRTSHLKLFSVRGSLLATSSIRKLLILAVNSYNASNFTDQSTPLNHNRSSLCKTLDQCLKLISFTLKVCFHNLKSIISIDGRSSGDPYKAIVFGDLKQLALPIMQLIWLLKSGAKVENNTTKKEAKGKRKFENKGSELHQALLCLNELFRMSSSKAYLTELIEVLDRLDTSELNLGNTVEAADSMDHTQAVTVDDPYVRTLHVFLFKRLKPLYSGLIALSLFQEAVVVSELFLLIWRTLPFEQRKLDGTWMMNVCKNKKIVNPKSAQKLVTQALHLMPSKSDLITAQDIASELLQVMGSEEKDPIEISRTYPFVNDSTKDAITVALFQLIESCLADLDWSVSKLKAISNVKYEFDLSTRDHQFPERSPGVILEEVVHSRSEALVNVLAFFTEMNLKDSQAEQFLKMTAKFYRLLTRMTKLRIASKGCKQLLPGQKFQKLAEVACRKLTSKLYNFVALVQRNQQENVRIRGIINKIKRENKCIPDLIFQIEDYERYLIQLSKLTKVNLLRNAKRSTVRDFKILEIKKTAAQEEEIVQKSGSISSNSSQDDSGNESEGPSEDNPAEKVASPDPIGEDGAAEDSESDEDVHVLIRNKRTKMSKVVHDSEDEA